MTGHKAQKPSILVVDDSLDGREMLAEYLRFRGFSVVTAESGESAVETVRRVRPTVVLMDLSLPGPSVVREGTRAR